MRINKKKNRRLHPANLVVKWRKRRKGVTVPCEPLVLPTQRNEVWSMDFVMVALVNCRRINILTAVDDCTAESIDLVTDFGISGHYVTRILDQAARFISVSSLLRLRHPVFLCNIVSAELLREVSSVV